MEVIDLYGKKESVLFPKNTPPLINITQHQINQLRNKFLQLPVVTNEIPLPNLLIQAVDRKEVTVVMYDPSDKHFEMTFLTNKEGLYVKITDKNGIAQAELVAGNEEADKYLQNPDIYEREKKEFVNNNEYFNERYKWFWELFWLIQRSFLSIDEVFDLNPLTKKHRIKPRKSYDRGGDDEELYTVLKGYQSHKGTAKGTGLGTKHSHEYGVRGFWRHLKSGLQVWVKPHQRCVGRGAETQHEYLVTKGE